MADRTRQRGQDITGLIVEETPTEITLRDANGKDYNDRQEGHRRRRRRVPVSIMPEDIVAALTEDELIDLVEYLLTLKTASLTPDSWHIVGPFANDESDSGLDQVEQPEKTVDLTATYKGKSGDVKWSRVWPNADRLRRSDGAFRSEQHTNHVVPVPRDRVAGRSRRDDRCSAPTTARSCGSTARRCTRHGRTTRQCRRRPASA